MSRRRLSRPLNPLVLPIVAIVLTLVVGVLVLIHSVANREVLVPVPGPTVTVSAPTTPG